ncbi:MAG: hypothetical protein ICV73_24035, partial [Acetobacteraceae bacterium]|nr:hypothetical protein [Acetobacteraceae bacterium]
MAVSITLPDVSPLAGSPRPAATTPAAAIAAGRGLLARCADWLRCRSDAARLREMDPHLARDIGLVPDCGDRGPDGFAVDPRPLWGIGLTPQPV